MDEVKMLGTIGIDYMPAIKAAKQFAQSLEQINAYLRQTQSIAKSTGAVFAHDLARKFEKTNVIYDKHGNILSEVRKQTRAVNEEAERHAKSIERAARSHTFLQHRMGWFVSGAVFYGLQDIFRQTVEMIGEVEAGMVEISRISDDAFADFREMRNELLNLGIQFGRSWEEVQDIALRWSQAGYNVADTLELTKASLAGLNTAEMNAETATQSLIGIMAQWQLSTEELLPLIDKLNITADNFSVTTQDLVDGLLRSSGAAKTLGMTLEETIAIITAMREASGRTGKEVGNALNTILTYIQRPSTVNTLERAGIRVFADEAKTQFRDLFDILNDLGEQWNNVGQSTKEQLVEMAENAGLYNEEIAKAVGLQEEWNDLQRRDVSMSVAGTRRRNYLIGLLQKWAEVDEVLISMENALGYSMEENERTMETYRAKVQQLQTALQMLAVEIGEAGLLDFMKGMTDEVRGWIEYFTQLPEEVQQVIVLFVELAAVLGTLQLASKTFLDVGLSEGLKLIAARMAGVTTASMTMGVALKTLATNPVTILITAIGGAIIALRQYKKWQEQATERTVEAVTSHIEAAEKARAQAEEIKRLVAEYESYVSKTNRTVEENKKLKEVTQDIVDILPSAASGFDEAGNAIANLESITKASRIELQKLNDQMKKNIEFAAAVAEDKLPEIEQKRNDALEKLNELQEAYMSADPGEALFEIQKKYGMLYISKAYPDPKYREEFRSVEVAKEKIASLAEETRETFEELDKAYREIKRSIDLGKKLDEIDETTSETVTETIEGFERTGETSIQAYERLNKKYKELNHLLRIGKISNEEYIAGLQEIEQQMREAGIEEEKIWRIQEEIYQMRQGGSRTLEFDSETLSNIERIRAIRQTNIELLEYEYEHLINQRNAVENMNRVNEIRVQLLQLYNEKQLEYQNRIREQQKIIQDAQKAQAQLNTETEIGQRRYEQYNAIIAEAQRQITNFKIGTLELSESLETLNSSLADMISNDWIQRLEEALSDAQEEIEEDIEEIDEDIEELKSGLREFRDDVNSIFDDLEERDREFNLDNLLSKLDEAAEKLRDVASGGAISDEPLVDYSNIVDKLPERFEDVADMIDEITGEYSPDENLFDLDTDDFLDAVEDNVDDLYDASEEINEALQEIAEERQRVLDAIDAEIAEVRSDLESELAELQAQLDALDEEEEQDQKEKARREHEERLQELYEKRRYHELRTGKEHKEAILEIDEEIAKERQRWEELQTKWQREEERERIKEEMDAARERAEQRVEELQEERDLVEQKYDLLQEALQDLQEYVDAEIDEWERLAQRRAEIEEERVQEQIDDLEEEKERLRDHWNDAEDGIRAIMEQGVIDTIADMAAHDPEFYSRGEAMIQKLIEGLENKKGDLEGIIDDINDVLDGIGGIPGDVPGGVDDDSPPEGWEDTHGTGGWHKDIDGTDWGVDEHGNVYRDGEYTDDWDDIPEEVKDIARRRRDDDDDSSSGGGGSSGSSDDDDDVTPKDIEEELIDMGYDPWDPDLPDDVVEEAERRAREEAEEYHQGGIVGHATTSIAALANEFFNKKANERILKGIVGELYVTPENLVKYMKPNLAKMVGMLAVDVAKIPYINSMLPQLSNIKAALDYNFDKLIRALNTRSVQIGTLFNSENTYLGDEVDADVISRSLMRSVNLID